MRRTPFRRKILMYSSALLIALIVTTLAYVGHEANGFVGDRLEADIKRGRDRIVEAEQQRLQELLLSSRIITSLPQLRPLITDTDGPTVRDYLQTYQQGNRAASDLLLIALDPSGRVIARTDKTEPGAIPALGPLIQSAAGDSATGVVPIDEGVWHVAISPATAGGNLFAWVAVAAPLDTAYARKLGDLIASDIVIVGDRVLGSNLNDLPWHTRAEWDAVIQPGPDSHRISLANETYAATAVSFGGSGPVRPVVVIMQSQDRAMVPYRQIQGGLLLMGMIVAVLGVAGSAIFARNITAPVAKLVEGTRQVASGNFDYRLDVRTGDEIGELAQSFNAMTQGLRERADMQKFVSQSTVDMIQSTEQKKVSAGERVTLTVLFSDMRGFTSMTENMPPEETVKLLNSCLSLQAEKVKKFRGDIDKFVGDCVVALFSGDDMELNAIRCSVEIHRALDAFNASNAGDLPIRVGIGIVTGELILGSIGSVDRLDYTVIGSNVNLCSRLCSHAGPRETLLSASTFARVEGLIAAEKLEPLPVKGFSEPVTVYRMKLA